MQLDAENEKPIFIQLAESIKDNILKGIYPEETQIPSTTEVAVILKINPATVNRGVNLLVDGGIIYKKRGVGMFVCQGAHAKILAKHKQAFYQNFLLPMLDEAKNLGLSREDVVVMLNSSTTIEPAEGRISNEPH
ncbi:MAG: GntR family transcriptional regulator [Anaerolinea sp.]|nr:GntR family transcriptional regulator [Anaerolinea sp.]